MNRTETEGANLQDQGSAGPWRKKKHVNKKNKPDPWLHKNKHSRSPSRSQRLELCKKIVSVLTQHFTKSQMLCLVQLLGHENTLQTFIQSIKDACEKLPDPDQANTKVGVSFSWKLTSGNNFPSSSITSQSENSHFNETCFDQLREKLGLHVTSKSFDKFPPGSTTESLETFEELLGKTLDDLDVLEQISTVTVSTHTRVTTKFPSCNHSPVFSTLKKVADSSSVDIFKPQCTKSINNNEKAKSNIQEKLPELSANRAHRIPSKRLEVKRRLRKVYNVLTNETHQQLDSFTDENRNCEMKDRVGVSEFDPAPDNVIPVEKSDLREYPINDSSVASTSLKRMRDAVIEIIPIQNSPQKKKKKKKKEKTQVKDQGDLILIEYPHDSPTIILQRALETYEIKLEWKADEIDGAHVCSVYFNDIRLVQALGHSAKKARREASATALKELQKYHYTIKVTEGSNEVLIHRENFKNYSRETDLNHNNVGFKMMESMGWSGGGLGKSSQGITEPITLEPQYSRAGIGIEKKLDKKDFKKKCSEILRDHLQNDPLSELVFHSFTKKEIAVIKQVAPTLGFKMFQSDCDDQSVVRLYQDRNAKEIFDALLRLQGSSGTYKLIEPLINPNAVRKTTQLDSGDSENHFYPAFAAGFSSEHVFQANSSYEESSRSYPHPDQFQVYTSSYFANFL